MNFKLIVVCGLLAVPAVIEAMPSAAELDAVAPVVQELMQPEQDALKAGKKTKTEVADAAIALVSQADGEAAKLLLAKGAFGFYVRAGAFDKAEETLDLIRTEIPDVPPQYLANLIETSLKRVSRKNGGQLYRILDETKVLARYANETKKLETQAKAKPADTAIMTKLAEHYAVLGDWAKALDAFEKCGDAKAAGAAKDEKSGAADAKAIADFWWDYPNKKDAELEKPFKQHAAKLYADAVASGKLVGLNKVQVERRIKEAESLGEPVAQEPAATTSGGGRKLYCVIDLSGGPNAAKYPVSYLNDVPKGGWTDEYKTTKLVLRRIEPGSFEYAPGKRFRITKPFHIGVFEVSQKQYELVMGNNPSEHKGDMRPVERVSYKMLRGSTKGVSWPLSQEVDDETFMSRIRKRTSLYIDFPTEVQWEYACRAGTKSKFNDGGDSKQNMLMLGKCSDNGGREEHSVVVGSFRPNRWGLYDMHGNVYEWCLDRCSDISPMRSFDWSKDQKDQEKDHVGAFTGKGVVRRGGSWYFEWGMCASSIRSSEDINGPQQYGDWGFRLAIQPPFVPPKPGKKK